jgi:peptidoglycan/LPS O-acetylase OafA/YrhL
MEKRNMKSTKIMAYIGTILVFIPILLTLLTGTVATIASGIMRVDYLMPAELFPLAMAGALILLWASRRARIYKGLIAWSLAVMVGSLVASQGTAVLTGLASGKTEAAGWPLFLVVALLALYVASVILQCILGVLLIRRCGAPKTVLKRLKKK